MANDEILRRLDAHMERGNEIMRRSDETMRRSNEVIEQNRRAFGDLRLSLRQDSMRQERTTRAVIRALDDLVAESRAQREALFRMLDRLDDGGATSGA